MVSTWCRALAPVAVLTAALLPVHAQQPPVPASPPQQSPFCARLESQLQAFDRSSSDAARADQMRKLQDTAAGQQAEIDRQEAAAKRTGCQSNDFFALFSGQPAACGPLNNKIKQLKANLDDTRSSIERLQGDPAPERDSQRRAILVALAQNNCGQQYQAQVAATPPPQQQRTGLFESLFGPKPSAAPGESPAVPGLPGLPGAFDYGGTYRTICVRTCDGFYYPISYSTTQSHFAEDEKVCRQSCPAAEVMLFAHKNPGEDVNQAVSISGQPYTSLPNAFRYRQSLDSSCSCRHPGESWSQALKNLDDNTVEQGDIVVNEQRARQLSQPRVDAQGKPVKTDPTTARPAANPSQAAAPAPPSAANASTAPVTETPDKRDPNRPVRAVGPTFIPAR
jgi:uncharacterized protein DUF2865